MNPTEQVPSSLVNMGTLKDQRTVANDFKTFCNNFRKIKQIQIWKRDAISFLKDSFPGNIPTINIIPITEAEINSISSLKPKNSSSYEEITSKIIKSCASLISIPLSYIYYYSLQTRIFPDSLRIAVVKPLHKKGDKFNISNYRPISPLPTFAEIVEKAMYSRLSRHLQINNIQAPEQYAFRKGMSNEDAAFRLTVYLKIS